MMLHTTHPFRANPRLAAAAAAALALAACPSPSAAFSTRSDAQRSLVRCTPVRLSMPGAGPGPVRTIEGDRFFAPTRQAVFFFRAGDRCTWHASHLARG